MKRLSGIISCITLLCAFACQKEVEVVRDEYIRFYSDKDMSKEISVLQIPFEGDSAKIIVKTNADVNVKFEPQQEEGVDSWITFSEPVKLSDGEFEISYVASHLVKDLTQRTASVNVTVPTIWLGRFLKVCQGYRSFWTPQSADAPKTVTSLKQWNSASITKISDLSHAYISFNAYSVCRTPLPAGWTAQLQIDLSKGAVFEDNGLQSYVVDVALGSEFNWTNLVALPFKSLGGAFATDTKVSLSLLSDVEGLAVHIDNLKIYNVTGDLLEEGDGEELEDPEAGELEDIE